MAHHRQDQAASGQSKRPTDCATKRPTIDLLIMLSGNGLTLDFDDAGGLIDVSSLTTPQTRLLSTFHSPPFRAVVSFIYSTISLQEAPTEHSRTMHKTCCREPWVSAQRAARGDRARQSHNEHPGRPDASQDL